MIPIDVPGLGERAPDAHKGDFGTVLIIGGQPGMAGAPLMAGMAAQRTGAGKVIIATDVSHAPSLVVNSPSIMAYGVKDKYALSALLKLATHIVIGPGLGQTLWAQELLDATLSVNLPLLLDADALNLLSMQTQKKNHWILTPHMGEAARLLGCTVSDIKADREQAIIQLQKKYGGVIVLKGAHTLIVDDELQPRICYAGNPGMASAGMGDILSGVIVALAAQGMTLFDAAQLGVSVHAKAGDDAAKDGVRGMIATDLLPFIRQHVNTGGRLDI